jgi:hypothetical protein
MAGFAAKATLMHNIELCFSALILSESGLSWQEGKEAY